MPRVTSVQEVIDHMPDRFKPEQAASMNAVVQFDLSGQGGGQWFATIKDGALRSAAGTAPNPNVTLLATAADFLAMVNGDMSPMGAFMKGKVKVKGDMNLVMRLQSLFAR